MSRIAFTRKGDCSKTRRLLENAKNGSRIIYSSLDDIGREGVDALRAATPRDTGKTADSWKYRIETGKNKTSIVWYNENVVNGWADVSILIQYGHATRNGGWVQGIDYINPALRPIFEQLSARVWREVMRK